MPDGNTVPVEPPVAIGPRRFASAATSRHCVQGRVERWGRKDRACVAKLPPWQAKARSPPVTETHPTCQCMSRRCAG